MFTLKIAKTGSEDGSATWIADVQRVHLQKIGTKGADNAAWAKYREQITFQDYTENLEEGRDIALLTVVHSDGHDYALACGRAWLLNGDGKIVERITP